MDNFINYLDVQKAKNTMDYIAFADFSHTINMHFKPLKIENGTFSFSNGRIPSMF